jgi:hypothetical protein
MTVTLIANSESEAGALESLPETPGLNIVQKADLEGSERTFGPEEKLLCTSESILDLILERLDAKDNRKSAIALLKDKTAFRHAIKPMFPDFYFEEIDPTLLDTLGLDADKQYVIKPSKGCFGTGVKIVAGDVDLKKIAEQIMAEVKRNSALFSSAVLTEDRVIVEEFIEGEEYAVDMFYDAEGNVVITNIYHHPMPKNPAYLHMLYTTSKEVFEKIYAPAKNFFEELSRILDVRSMPIHSEFKLRDGQLVPIELNPMRFGGMGLCNLSYHAMGQNAYTSFVEDQEHDWGEVWQEQGNSLNAFVIAYNGQFADLAKQEPDWEKLRGRFQEVIHEIPFDYQKQLAFGILYVRVAPDSLDELLAIEFDDFFVDIS